MDKGSSVYTPTPAIQWKAWIMSKTKGQNKRGNRLASMILSVCQLFPSFSSSQPFYFLSILFKYNVIMI